MEEQKNIVVSIRLSPTVMAALTARAEKQRQPVRRMAALLIEDAVIVKPPPPAMREEVTPRFKRGRV